MPQNFQTTFIPQGGASGDSSQSSRSASTDTVRVRQTVSILTVGAALFVVVALISIGGVFVLEQSLTQKIAQMERQLETAEKQFEPTLIVQLKQLDERLKQASNVLRSHRSVAPFFSVLNTTASKNVQYDTMSLELNSDGLATVEIEGQARSYQVIAQQSRKLSEQNLIQDHIFSEFELQDTGRVRFALLLTLSAEALLFENVIQDGIIGSATSVPISDAQFQIPASTANSSSAGDTGFISS